MPQSAKRFVFRLPWIVSGAVATVLSLLLGALEVGGWINETAPWVLWLLVVALIVISVFLIARMDALGQARRGIAEELVDARATAAEAEAKRVTANARVLELEALLQRPKPLSDVDRNLARQLYEYSSEPETLDMLSEFFSYRIPRAPVSSMEALARLPLSRSAYNEQLGEHLTALADVSTQWLTKFRRIASTDGEHYTTRLDHYVTQKAYEQHAAMTDDLESASFELHQVMLEYQRYYASLEI